MQNAKILGGSVMQMVIGDGGCKTWCKRWLRSNIIQTVKSYNMQLREKGSKEWGCRNKKINEWWGQIHVAVKERLSEGMKREARKEFPKWGGYFFAGLYKGKRPCYYNVATTKSERKPSNSMDVLAFDCGKGFPFTTNHPGPATLHSHCQQIKRSLKGRVVLSYR